MKIVREENRIVLNDENDMFVGEITYQKTNDKFIIIDHTLVNSEYEGKGYARMLVDEAVLFAKENNLKIIPLCPYVKRVFEKVSEYQELEYKK